MRASTRERAHLLFRTGPDDGGESHEASRIVVEWIECTVGGRIVCHQKEAFGAEIVRQGRLGPGVPVQAEAPGHR